MSEFQTSILLNWKNWPVTNQVGIDLILTIYIGESHPRLILCSCTNTVQEKGIVFTACTPLGLGQTFLTDPVFLDINKEVQVVISRAVL
jgi:diketogulonate reductase-like aldo/keto reductase